MYFDRKTLRVLRYIKMCGDRGAEWGKLQKKFGADANIFCLELLDKERYVVTQDENGNWINLGDKDIHRDSRFKSFATAKGNELLEKRLFDFWKFIIPTIISVLALLASLLSLVFSIY